jgi:hypothetical protein
MAYIPVFVNKLSDPESTANFLERGGDGCELRVSSCEVKNFGVVFLSQFFKALPRKPATVKHVTRNRLSFFLTVDLELMNQLLKNPEHDIFNVRAG